MPRTRRSSLCDGILFKPIVDTRSPIRIEPAGERVCDDATTGQRARSAWYHLRSPTRRFSRRRREPYGCFTTSLLGRVIETVVRHQRVRSPRNGRAGPAGDRVNNNFKTRSSRVFAIETRNHQEAAGRNFLTRKLERAMRLIRPGAGHSRVGNSRDRKAHAMIPNYPNRTGNDATPGELGGVVTALAP